MTALNGTSEPDLDELTALTGLEAVTTQFAGLVAILRAEQARRQTGIQISRPVWKNLVFTGGPGTGKSRTAQAIARAYHDLGVLTFGRLIEIAAADLIGATPSETRTLIDKAIVPTGEVLMITDAHSWHDLPDRGQHALRCLYHQLTEARKQYSKDELVIILAGQPSPLRDLLRANLALAARFPAIIDFPGYTFRQLTTVFETLAAEAGFTLTPDATRKAAAALAHTETAHASGNARLAVRLLTQVTANQAARITAAPQPQDPIALSTICAGDIPEYLFLDDPAADDQRPGQYL